MNRPTLCLRVGMCVTAACLCAIASFSQGGTIGYWRFEGGSLASTVNSPALDGSATGSPAADPGVPGTRIAGQTNAGSLSFNGSSSVQVAYAADNPLLQASTFTIEAFIKTTSTTQWPGIVEKVSSSGGDTWSLGLTNNFIIFSRFDTTTGYNQTLSAGSALNNGQWHHVAMTYDGATGSATLFADYRPTTSKTIAGLLAHARGLDIAGGGGGHNPYTGLIDEVRMSDTVLTPDQFLFVQRTPERVVENASRQMAAADFDGDGAMEIVLATASGVVVRSWGAGVADGSIRPGSVLAVTTADVDGDGQAEVAAVTAGKQLQTWVPGGAVTTWTPPSGVSGWKNLSAGDINGDGSDEIMLVQDVAAHGALYVLQDGATYYCAGTADIIASGDTVGGDGKKEFLVRGTTGRLYRSKAPGSDGRFSGFDDLGGGIWQITSGNTFPSDSADEILVNNSSKLLYVHNGGYSQADSGSGTNMMAGCMDPALWGQELWYIIGTDGKIYQSRWNWAEAGPSSGWSWDLLKVNAKDYAGANVAGNSNWSDLLLADIDGDGLDELIARKAGAEFDNLIFFFENGQAGFTSAMLVPEPLTVLAVLTGLTGLGGYVRRRRGV
ncbi:MAG: FG-GAP repeat protein [Planctomycetes bacterium ADurb.Bin126]|nr:MAG: FG-GAP repeat protein [Planctomycetes bacterium ADurb.Bin126]HOD80149.1 LamG domain-containing protein [Phycisphaerae bacterium]HQL71622.1 LamG domain-containing protein [Phycisphaerae bacterium]